MRIYSKVLTLDDIRNGLTETGLAAEGVSFDDLWEAWKPVTRGAFAGGKRFDVSLKALPGEDRFGNKRRAARYSRGLDSSEYRSATWHEHGVWMNYLFQIDPDASIAGWKGIGDFHKWTNCEFSNV